MSNIKYLTLSFNKDNKTMQKTMKSCGIKLSNNLRLNIVETMIAIKKN